jgi:hypothetical protein
MASFSITSRLRGWNRSRRHGLKPQAWRASANFPFTVIGVLASDAALHGRSDCAAARDFRIGAGDEIALKSVRIILAWRLLALKATQGPELGAREWVNGGYAVVGDQCRAPSTNSCKICHLL